MSNDLFYNTLMPDQERITQIINELFSLNSPTIDDSIKEPARGFIADTINGDEVLSYLVINSNFGKDRKGAIVYALTNARLIKISIEGKNIESIKPNLSEIVNFERKLVDGNRLSVGISFSNDEFIGLRYSAKNEGITAFFQKVDQSRPRRKTNG